MNVTLVLTRDCNLRCRYCYAGRKVDQRMSSDLAKRAIDWAFDRHRGPKELQIGYFGGEPLLAWDLLQRAHAHVEQVSQDRGIPFKGTYTTNGTLLTDEKMVWSRAHTIIPAVSIDGDREAHDRTRRGVGGVSVFDDTLRGLRIALKHAPLTEALCVIDPCTVDRLATSVAFILEQGTRVLGLSVNYSADWDEASLAVYEEQLNQVGDLYADCFRRGHDVYFSCLDAKIITHIKGGLAECDKCTAGTGELALAPSGNWYPCERMVGDDGETEARYCLGNGHETRHGGPDGKRVIAITKGQHRLDPTCEDCAHKSRCMTHCACSNVMSGGTFTTPGGSVCLTEQIHIAVADRVAAELFKEQCPLFLRKHYRLDH